MTSHGDDELFEGEPKEQWRKDLDAGKVLDMATGRPIQKIPDTSTVKGRMQGGAKRVPFVFDVSVMANEVIVMGFPGKKPTQDEVINLATTIFMNRLKQNPELITVQVHDREKR